MHHSLQVRGLFVIGGKPQLVLIRSILNQIFRLMDQDEDGKLSMDEFKLGAQQDPSILQALTLYGGLL